MVPSTVWPGSAFASLGVTVTVSWEGAADSARVAWLMRVPNASTRWDGMSAPSVSGGVIYVGTNEGGSGHVMAFADPRIAPSTGQLCLAAEGPLVDHFAYFQPVSTICLFDFLNWSS